MTGWARLLPRPTRRGCCGCLAVGLAIVLIVALLTLVSNLRQERAERALRAEFLELARHDGRDTVIFWDPVNYDLRALDFVRSQALVLHKPDAYDGVSDASASPTEARCAFTALPAASSAAASDRRHVLVFLGLKQPQHGEHLPLPWGLYTSSPAPAWSPDGKRLAVVCKPEGSNTEVVVLVVSVRERRLEAQHRAEVGPLDALPDIVWSADGRTLYLDCVGTYGDGQPATPPPLSLAINVATGAVRPIYEYAVLDAAAGGEMLVWTPREGPALRSGDGGVRELRGRPSPWYSPRFWPGGRFVVLYSDERMWAPWRLRVYDVQKGVSAPLVDLYHAPPPEGLSITRRAWLPERGPYGGWRAWHAE